MLMNATPGHISLEAIRVHLCRLPEVLGVHYLHAWQVSSNSTAFSCHVVVPDQPVSRTEHLTDRIKHELLHRFRIDHPVLQFETASCGQGNLLCGGLATGRRAAFRKRKKEAGSRMSKVVKGCNKLCSLCYACCWAQCSFTPVMTRFCIPRPLPSPFTTTRSCRTWRST